MIFNYSELYIILVQLSWFWEHLPFGTLYLFSIFIFILLLLLFHFFFSIPLFLLPLFMNIITFSIMYFIRYLFHFRFILICLLLSILHFYLNALLSAIIIPDIIPIGRTSTLLLNKLDSVLPLRPYFIDFMNQFLNYLNFAPPPGHHHGHNRCTKQKYCNDGPNVSHAGLIHHMDIYFVSGWTVLIKSELVYVFNIPAWLINIKFMKAWFMTEEITLHIWLPDDELIQHNLIGSGYCKQFIRKAMQPHSRLQMVIWNSID